MLCEVLSFLEFSVERRSLSLTVCRRRQAVARLIGLGILARALASARDKVLKDTLPRENNWKAFK